MWTDWINKKLFIKKINPLLEGQNLDWQAAFNFLSSKTSCIFEGSKKNVHHSFVKMDLVIVVVFWKSHSWVNSLDELFDNLIYFFSLRIEGRFWKKWVFWKFPAFTYFTKLDTTVMSNFLNSETNIRMSFTIFFGAVSQKRTL